MSYSYKPPAPTKPSQTRFDIEEEFRRWNQQSGERVIGPDYDLPMQRANEKGATVVFFLRGQRINMTISTWTDFATNLRCCYLNIRDMRLSEARGSLEGLREAMLQLPAPVKERDPYEVLGVRPDAAPEDIEAMYKIKANRLHPDKGGTSDQMAELNAAYEKVRR